MICNVGRNDVKDLGANATGFRRTSTTGHVYYIHTAVASDIWGKLFHHDVASGQKNSRTPQNLDL